MEFPRTHFQPTKKKAVCMIYDKIGDMEISDTVPFSVLQQVTNRWQQYEIFDYTFIFHSLTASNDMRSVVLNANTQACAPR